MIRMVAALCIALITALGSAAAAAAAAAGGAGGANAGAVLDGPAFCGTQVDGITTPGQVSALYLDLACGYAGRPATIAAVDFARYGSPPDGSCGSYTAPAAGCAAPNSTSVVAAACVGQQACRLWPNTTTFGDPCLGTRKSLYVQARCTSGPGTATPGCLSLGGSRCPPSPTPPPAPPAPIVAAASVEWTNTTETLQTVPSLQVRLPITMQ